MPDSRLSTPRPCSTSDRRCILQRVAGMCAVHIGAQEVAWLPYGPCLQNRGCDPQLASWSPLHSASSLLVRIRDQRTTRSSVSGIRSCQLGPGAPDGRSEDPSQGQGILHPRPGRLDIDSKPLTAIRCPQMCGNAAMMLCVLLGRMSRRAERRSRSGESHELAVHPPLLASAIFRMVAVHGRVQTASHCSQIASESLGCLMSSARVDPEALMRSRDHTSLADRG